MNQDYLLSNQTYDLLRRIVTILLPSMTTLYAVSEAVWDPPNPVAVLGTLGALALLGGLLMAISTKSWDNSVGKYDGTLTIVGDDPDTGLPNLRLNVLKDPMKLTNNKTLYYMSIDERE